MVIKVAFERAKAIRHYPKQFPWHNSYTKPGRGYPKKVISKWTRLKHVFNRRVYTSWFGNSRFILLISFDQLDNFGKAAYQKKLREWGVEMCYVKQTDCVPVFNNMGLYGLSNALRSSASTPTLIIYSYGNELSPLGNIESIPLIKKIIKEFHKNKRNPNAFVLGGAIDRQQMTHTEITSILDYTKPDDHWSSLSGLLNISAQVPSVLQSSQISLINLLQYYTDMDSNNEPNDET